MEFLTSPILRDWLDRKYLNEKAIEKLQSKYSQPPFPHIYLKDLIKKRKAAEVLKALAEEKFVEKEADLFQFMQTADLSESENAPIKEFRGFLSSKPFVSFLSTITKFQLRPHKIDISGSLYQNTDFLLCHNDKIEGRKIAFMFYLSDLKKKDGGSFQMYSCKKGQPITVGKKVVPQFNSLLLFTVTPESFHSVEEVIVNKQRITLSGWYYG